VGSRVDHVAFPHRHAVGLGAWDMPTRASAMELNIPGIHGVADTLIYFVDRDRDFFISHVELVHLSLTPIATCPATAWTSCRSRARSPSPPPSPACIGSASCNRSSAIAPPTG